MIFVTVGAEQYRFNALMAWIDVLIRYGFIDEEVIIDYGASTRLPNQVKIVRLSTDKELKAMIHRARIVVSHCSENMALILEESDKPYILVPRTQKFDEHVDDHQLELADALEKQGVAIARSISDLVKFLAVTDLAKFLEEAGLINFEKPSNGSIKPLNSEELFKFMLTPKLFKYMESAGLIKFLSVQELFRFSQVPDLYKYIEGFSPKTSKIANYLRDRYTQKKVMLVCSGDGHFTSMQELRAFWLQCVDPFWVTFRNNTTQSELRGKRVYYAYSPTNRNLVNFIRNLFMAIIVILKERPKLAISTGAGVSVPFLLIAKYLCCSETIFIESKSRFTQLSLSARLLLFFRALDQLFVQGRELTKLYPQAQYLGDTEENLQPDQVTNTKEILKPTSMVCFKEIMIVSTPTRLGATEAARFLNDFRDICQTSYRKIIVDMSATTFINVSGLGALRRAHQSSKASGNEMVLWSVNKPVMDILSNARLVSRFTTDLSSQTLKVEIMTLLIRAHSSYKQPETLESHASVRSIGKRAIDIVGAIIGLSVTALLYIPIAIAIKLDSPGPVLFNQTRYGLMSKRFRIWKFRSMVPNAEELKDQVKNEVTGNFFKNEQDFRVTRVGKFLRKTSLDEFPQFWNVLIGDMSLVGTRPPTEDEVNKYKLDLYKVDKDTITEWSRLDVKPGITGEWQVHGRSSIHNFEDVVKLDVKYQNNWSLKRDLWLIWKTIWVLFDKNNAAV